MADLGSKGSSIAAIVQPVLVSDDKPAGGDSAPSGEVAVPFLIPLGTANNVKPR